MRKNKISYYKNTNRFMKRAEERKYVLKVIFKFSNLEYYK